MSKRNPKFTFDDHDCPHPSDEACVLASFANVVEDVLPQWKITVNLQRNTLTIPVNAAGEKVVFTLTSINGQTPDYAPDGEVPLSESHR